MVTEKKEVNKKELDLKNLKALAYDLMANIQLLQNDLVNVNSRIQRKAKE